MFEVGDLVTPKPNTDYGWYSRGLILAEVTKVINKSSVTIVAHGVANNSDYDVGDVFGAASHRFKKLESK